MYIQYMCTCTAWCSSLKLTMSCTTDQPRHKRSCPAISAALGWHIPHDCPLHGHGGRPSTQTSLVDILDETQSHPKQKNKRKNAL